MNRHTKSLATALLTSRREFILAGASLAVLPLLGSIAQGQVKKNPSFKSDPFQSGIASGDPSPDGMVLWTRLVPKPLEGDGGMEKETIEVTWEVAADDAMKKIVQRGTALATPQLGHSVHVEMKGLEADRWYWYRFTAGDAQSTVGRTRTTPAHDASPDKLRFAIASCQHFEAGFYTAYDHMTREDLDMVVFLGDYIYEGGGSNGKARKHHGKELASLEDYRTRYAQYRTAENLRAAHARCPWLVTWDDHEVDNNYAGDISEQSDVSPQALLLRRAAAYQAYYESMPLRAQCVPKGPDMQLYRRVQYGQLAQFEMLDTRQYRTDQPNGDRLKPLKGDVFSPKGTLLGDKQERWLFEGLGKSESKWNILGQQVMMGRVDRVAGEDAGYSMDQWSGYDVARKRLLSFLASRSVPNPVVLTGDIHTNWVNDLKVDFDREKDPVVATEFVGTSISSSGNGIDKPKNHDALLAENPFVRFHNAQRGYISCTVTPKDWRSDYQVVEYVDRPGSPQKTRASFVVESGKAGAQKA